MLLLCRQGMWASLEIPQAHADAVCLLTSVLLRNQLISRGVIQSVSQWLNSHSENLQLTATALFAELMKEPPDTERKFLESVLDMLMEKAQHGINTVGQMAVRGLGNTFRRASEKVRKHKKAILEALQRCLEDVGCPELVAESMLALAKVVRKLRPKDLGSAFQDITRMFFEAEQEVLRSSAFSLYAALASSASGNRSFFAREVLETWVSLLLHLRDPDPEVSKVCRTTLYLRAPFLRPEELQECITTSAGLSAADLQYEVCLLLARDAPEMLERLHGIAGRCCLENGQALHADAIAVLGDILEKIKRP
ncbi:protein maestro-like [Numida meleagris]|uniref:protein maestro-like n=1 Tax=Numida meleagris TaxID=8996 RepID=UPI000B3DD27F|nr:protein maestro-like [Numida meleagris]